MLFRSLGSLSFLLLAGCFDSSPPIAPLDSGTSDALPTDGACPDPADPLDAGLTSPTVSLKADIMPIFQFSCGIAGSTCHGATSVSHQGRPFLGYPDGGTDAATVYQALVGVASTEDPKMKLVTAGNLDESFLWQKVDNTMCKFAADCRAGGSAYPDCGQSMPYGNQALDVPTLTTIARWIAQGAPNN
jgi:hypothetical protein